MKTPDKAEMSGKGRGSLWPALPAAACDHRHFLSKGHGSKDQGAESRHRVAFKAICRDQRRHGLSRYSGYENREQLAKTCGTIHSSGHHGCTILRQRDAAYQSVSRLAFVSVPQTRPI